MCRLHLFLCLLIILIPGGASLAKEFSIGEYPAYSLLGEAKLNDGIDYVSFTGDFGFSGTPPTTKLIEQHLSHESKLLSNFLLSVINLEIILPGVSGDELDRQVDKLNIETLKKAGYDVVALANNHAMDHGAKGVSHNTTQLEKAGLAKIGTRNFPVYKWEPGGYRVAIYALTDNTDKEDPKRLTLSMDDTDLALVKEKTSQADFRIAFVHLGSMSSFPSPYESKQVERLLDIGAQLVVATGSHFVKGFVIKRGKPVVYGIGDHLFARGSGKNEPIGMHLVAGFKMSKLVQLFVVPYRNTLLEGKTGPLDKITFATFTKRFLERSTTDSDKYFSDPLALDKFKEALQRFKVSRLREIKIRHVVYGARIVFQNYPAVTTIVCLLALMFFLLVARSIIRSRR